MSASCPPSRSSSSRRAPRLQHLEYELFVFTAAAPDQHFEVLEGGRFDNFVTVAGVNVEDAPGYAAT